MGNDYTDHRARAPNPGPPGTVFYFFVSFLLEKLQQAGTLGQGCACCCRAWSCCCACCCCCWATDLSLAVIATAAPAATAPTISHVVSKAPSRKFITRLSKRTDW